MPIYHDEVELEEFTYDIELDIYTFPCPCGDDFQISKAELLDGINDASCPSCSLVIKVIYDLNKLIKEQEEISSEKKPQQQATQKA